MPIPAIFSPLQAQISNAFNLQQASNPQLVATVITTALTSLVSMGLFPVGVSMIPLIPAGAAATQSQIANAFNLQQASGNQIDAQLIALAISVLVPMVPPIGLTLLQNQIANALNLQQAATPQLIATMISTAIINYYLSGMVI